MGRLGALARISGHALSGPTHRTTSLRPMSTLSRHGSTLLLEEMPLHRIGAELHGAVVGGECGVAGARASKEISPRCVVGLIAVELDRVEGGQGGQAGSRATHL